MLLLFLLFINNIIILSQAWQSLQRDSVSKIYFLILETVGHLFLLKCHSVQEAVQHHTQSYVFWCALLVSNQDTR